MRRVVSMNLVNYFTMVSGILHNLSFSVSDIRVEPRQFTRDADAR